MASKMVYQFKAGTHVPAGATPDGVQAERDLIESKYGKATIPNSVDAVLKSPRRYPNLRSFGPVDEEDAMRRGVAEGIRLAYRSVVRVTVTDAGAPVSRPFRVIHAIPDQDGGKDLVFRHIDQIRKDPVDVRQLVKQLRADARAYAGKMEDILAEIEAALPDDSASSGAR